MILQSHILRLKCNQTVVCNADNLFILPPYLKSCLPEMHWKFPFDLNGKLTIVFLKVTSKIPKSWYTVVGQG